MHKNPILSNKKGCLTSKPLLGGWSVDSLAYRGTCISTSISVAKKIVGWMTTNKSTKPKLIEHQRNKTSNPKKKKKKAC
jgi:hypothetical protein